MRTYVADVDGVPIVAFRAENNEHAQSLANDKGSELQESLRDFNNPDGSPLWDGAAAILVRPATESEDDDWHTARDASVGEFSEGAVIDPNLGENLDDFILYLVPIVPSDNEEDDDDENDDVEDDEEDRD